MSLLGLALGAFLLWLLQGSLTRLFWQKGLTAKVAFCREAVFEGEEAALTETIVNAKYLPLAALHVKFQTGRELVFSSRENSAVTDRNYRSDIFSCLPWQKIQRRLTFTCTRRGYYRIRELDLTGYDPLWSSRFYAVLPADTALYVYPSFADAARLQIPLQKLTGTLAARSALFRDPFDLQSIRDYAPGDPYRDVNWKATARTGSLKVNVRTPASGRQVYLLLDGDSDRLWADSDLTEETVRLAAALANDLIRRQIPVGLVSNACDCLTGTPSALDPGAGKDHLTALLRLLARADFNSPAPAGGSSPGRQPMERFLSGLTGTLTASCGTQTVLCVLLSPCQRKPLADAFAGLCACAPGSLWILPFRPGEPLRLTGLSGSAAGQLFPWEVTPRAFSPFVPQNSREASS